MKKYLITLSFILLTISAYLLYENYQNTDVIKNVKIKQEKVKGLIISEKNSVFIKLNARKNNLPFHPVKVLKFNNSIFYIDSGKVFTLNLKNKKISEIKVPFKSHEIINMVLLKNQIVFLDKLNLIYIYDISKAKFIKRYNFNSVKDIEPQFISINSTDKLYILDNSQNKIFYINQDNLYTFNQNISNNLIQNANLNLTESVDFYKEKNSFYILNRGNSLKVISDNTSDDYDLTQQNDTYNYLKIYSNPKLKNLYLSGAYNSNIISVSKETKNIIGNYYLNYQGKSLAVYDLFIEKNTMYILADNNLIIHKFKENDFKSIDYKYGNDLLEKSLGVINLKNIKMPVDNGTSLPIHASVYPGARRLYRWGVHEGIDFFEEVNTDTPVVAVKNGTLIRADKNYNEISKITHDNILKKCKSLGYTPPEIADLLRGRQVVLLHENNVISVYCHLNEISNDFEVGQMVEQGDIIGYVGNSGTNDGVNNTGKGLHLHFEFHINDQSKNLEYYLGKYLTVEESMQIYQKILD